ncbi:collagen-like protein [Methylobacterium sp. 77]|uniref:collagen-like protein n=1 Tax=Methylobacterium sp. 77 TaxID=1101192 RepID=UPI0003A73327|nr:collagen-like protein [Methylobacterium sp. 77]
MRLDHVAKSLIGLMILAGSAVVPAAAQAPGQVSPGQPGRGMSAAPATDAAAAPGPGAARAKPRRMVAPSQPIQVYDARIEAGDLRISGSVRKGGTVVVLDEDISVMADSRGRFLFRLPYRPATCVAALKAGDDEREAVVANCAPAGEPGAKGDAGPQGEAGPQGMAGLAGAPGMAGPKGDTGPKGETGAKGDAGQKGEAGLKGETGPQGPAGPKGDTGSKGDTGPKGLAGTQGEPGAAGVTASTAASALRPVRSESCASGGCEVSCESGEAFVSAYCLSSGSPSFANGGASASCPSDAKGMVGFCSRL